MKSLLLIFTIMIMGCSNVNFEADPSVGANNNADNPTDPDDPGNPETTCGSEANPCPLDPLVDSAGVETILLTLGDQVGNELIVNGVSSQYLAETAVRYASPVKEPKILVVKDRNHNGESVYDTEYIAETLLGRYDATYLFEPESGLTAAHLAGYDLVWFNNPGYPMGKIATRDALIAFKGGVVLSGDDMSRGDGFTLTPLTGLVFVDNGTTVTCGGTSYVHDDNEGHQYRVTLDGSKFPGLSGSNLKFSYGNDIDNNTATSSVEVLAWAVGGPAPCTDKRATVVRYKKEEE